MKGCKHFNRDALHIYPFNKGEPYMVQQILSVNICSDSQDFDDFSESVWSFYNNVNIKYKCQDCQKISLTKGIVVLSTSFGIPDKVCLIHHSNYKKYINKKKQFLYRWKDDIL